MLMTCKEFATKFDMSYLQASNIINALVTAKVACKADTLKGGGRGRPTIVYDIKDKIRINCNKGEIE